MKRLLVLLIWTGIVQTTIAQSFNYIVPPDTQIRNLTGMVQELKAENAGLRSKVETLEYVLAVSDTLLEVKDSRLKKLNQEAEARIAVYQGQYVGEKAEREKLERDNRLLADDINRIQKTITGHKAISILALIGTIAAILVR